MFTMCLTFHKSRYILKIQQNEEVVKLQFTLRQARTHAGLTQEDVANSLGIDRGTYIRMEKEPQRATVKQINAISALTGIPVVDLFLGCNSTNVEVGD